MGKEDMTDQSDEKIFQNMSSVWNWILHSTVVELSIHEKVNLEIVQDW